LCSQGTQHVNSLWRTYNNSNAGRKKPEPRNRNDTSSPPETARVYKAVLALRKTCSVGRGICIGLLTYNARARVAYVCREMKAGK